MDASIARGAATVFICLGHCGRCWPPSHSSCSLPAARCQRRSSNRNPLRARNSFKGMSALAATPERPLQVLIIHGIGTPAPYQFEGFIQSLAQRFRLVQVPRGRSEPQTSGCSHRTPGVSRPHSPGPNPNHYYRSSRLRPGAALYLFLWAELRRAGHARRELPSWAPLTEQIKCDLAEDDGKAPQKQALASFARDFIDSRLGDVVLYGGTFRDNVMRPSVEAALCLVTGGTPGKTARPANPAFITTRPSSSPTASAATC